MQSDEKDLIMGFTTMPQNPNSCAFCHKTASELSSPLKKCGRCAETKYCSKECQKAAWPSHRTLCVVDDAELNKFQTGNGRFEHLAGWKGGAAVRDWSEIHELAISAIVRATVALEGGADHILDTQRTVVFYINPRDNRSDDNPARAFTISTVRTVLREEEGFLAHSASWDKMQASCKKLEALIQDQSEEIFLTRFRGTISVSYVTLGTGGLVHRQYGLWKPKGVDEAALDPQTRAALGDFVNLCIASIAHGHAFYSPDPHAPSDPEPSVAYYVRQNKRWKRRPVNGSARDVMAWYMVEQPDMYISGLTPRGLWLLYHRLWNEKWN